MSYAEGLGLGVTIGFALYGVFKLITGALRRKYLQ